MVFMSAAIVPARRRRPFDPRVAIGLVLVLASIAGVVAIVKSADRSVQVYSAAEALPIGTRITGDDLVAVPARLGAAAAKYLTAPPPASGYVVTRSIDKGELVPVAALGTAASETVATVVVPVSTAVATSIATGTSVDVWAAPKTTGQSFGPPAVIVSGATVARVVQPAGLVQSGSGTSLELRVQRDDIAAVLQALADEDSVSVVAVAEPVHG
jgi:SAF domain